METALENAKLTKLTTKLSFFCSFLFARDIISSDDSESDDDSEEIKVTKRSKKRSRRKKRKRSSRKARQEKGDATVVEPLMGEAAVSDEEDSSEDASSYEEVLSDEETGPDEELSTHGDQVPSEEDDFCTVPLSDVTESTALKATSEKTSRKPSRKVAKKSTCGKARRATAEVTKKPPVDKTCWDMDSADTRPGKASVPADSTESYWRRTWRLFCVCCGACCGKNEHLYGNVPSRPLKEDYHLKIRQRKNSTVGLSPDEDRSSVRIKTAWTPGANPPRMEPHPTKASYSLLQKLANSDGRSSVSVKTAWNPGPNPPKMHPHPAGEGRANLAYTDSVWS